VLEMASARIFELAAQFEVGDSGAARLEKIGSMRNFRHGEIESVDARIS
jgi:hypothetical protein